MRAAFADHPEDGESLTAIVLRLARNDDSKKQLDAIKFAAEYGFGPPPKKLDDSTVQRLAQQMLAQALEEAEVRAQVRDAIPIDEAEPAVDVDVVP